MNTFTYNYLVRNKLSLAESTQNMNARQNIWSLNDFLNHIQPGQKPVYIRSADLSGVKL